MSISRGVAASVDIINKYSFVMNANDKIDQCKRDIIKTPLVQELVNKIFPSPDFPPMEIYLSDKGIAVRGYDTSTGTYQPLLSTVYNDQAMNFVFISALALICQDLYPNIYDLPKVSTTEFSEQAEMGEFYRTLTMKREFMNQRLTPACDPCNVSRLAEMDPSTQAHSGQGTATKDLSKLAFGFGLSGLICGVLGLVFFLFGFVGTSLNLAAIIIGAISLRTGNKDERKKRKSITAIILAGIGIVFPIFFGIITAMLAF